MSNASALTYRAGLSGIIDVCWVEIKSLHFYVVQAF